MKLVLKEIRETRISLRIINENPIVSNDKSVLALKECNELMAIFIKSIENRQKKSKAEVKLETRLQTV